MLRSGFLLLSVTVICISVLAQDDKTAYLAWLDSIERENYIADEIILDDLLIKEELSDEQVVFDRFKKHSLINTDQFMHCLPGVSMMRRGNFANEPMLRGLTSDRYIATVDGMRIFGACTDKMDPVSSYVEPINLKSLDISLGADGNLMGSTTGGGINFNLRKPVFNGNKKITTSFKTNYGSASGSFNQALDVNISHGKIALRLSGVYRKAHNYHDGNGKEVKYSQYLKNNYAGSLRYMPKEGHLLSFDFLGDDAKDVGYPALPMDVAYARAKLFGLTYMLPAIVFVKNAEIKIYHNFIHHAMDDTQRDSVAMHMDMPGETRTSGGYLEGEIFHTSRGSLRVKTDYFRTFASAEMLMYPNNPEQLPMFMLTWPDVHRQAGGVGGNFKFNPTEKSGLNISARVELTNSYITSDFGERQLSIFNESGKKSRLNLLHNYRLSYSMGESIKNQFSIAYGERTPSVSEQFGYFLFNRLDGYDYIGDPDIEKEKNIHLEISQHLGTSRLQASGSMFSYYFRDYIIGVYDPELSAMTIGAMGVKWHQNTESAIMAGTELNSTFMINAKSYVSGNLTYVYGEDFEGDPLPQIPPLKVSVAFDQEVLGFTVHPEFEWSGDQKRVSEKYNERPTGSYYLLSVRFSNEWQAGEGSWKIAAGVDNLMDRAYREHFDIGNILRPGRNFYFQVSGRF